MSSYKIENSVAFVTGTGRKNGIGRAIVEALLKNGAKKVYASARDNAQLDDLVEQHGGRVVAVALDVANLSAIQALPLLYTDVTLLVNNAGYFGGTQTANVSLEEIEKEIAVNYIAPMAMANAFASVFDKVATETSNNKTEIKPSAIVNINSIASFVNFPLGGTYSASKAAAHSLTQAQRRDFASSLVIGVYPGPIDTDMADGIDMEKTPPSAVGQAVVDALKDGTEDVFPDPMAEQVYAGWKADAKAMEAQMTQMAQA